MGKQASTSAIIDGLLRFAALGGVVSVTVVAPNAIQMLEKPLDKLFDGLDKRSQERELQRIIYYMKQRGLLQYKSEDYEHGLIITKAGKKRAKESAFDIIAIVRPKKWDKQWRLVFFDIPEPKSTDRRKFTDKLRQLGFRQLQFSIWIHPFPCRSEIELVAQHFNLRKYVSYVEVSHIDNQKQLLEQFKSLIK